jgi:hypothetical protein
MPWLTIVGVSGSLSKGTGTSNVCSLTLADRGYLDL